jgi:hypothetical protein
VKKKNTPYGFYDLAFRSAPNSALGGRRSKKKPILALRAGNRIARTLTTQLPTEAHWAPFKRAHRALSICSFFFHGPLALLALFVFGFFFFSFFLIIFSFFFFF